MTDNNIVRLSDVPTNKSGTLLLYGPAGSGKTVDIGTINSSRVLYANVEDRLATFQSPWFKKKFPNFNPFIVTVNEQYTPDSGAKALDELVDKINAVVEKYNDDIDFICVDGATALRRFALNKSLELNQKLGKSQTLDKLKALSKQSEVNVIDVTVQDYGMEMRMIANFILQMKEFCATYNKHFIMTAHERIQFEKPSSIGAPPLINSIKPGFTGQTFPDELPGIFDGVFHTETEGAGDLVKYFVRTTGDKGLMAKHSWGGLFKVKEYDFSLQEWARRIQS